MMQIIRAFLAPCILLAATATSAVAQQADSPVVRLWPVEEGGKFGYSDRFGQLVIPHGYDFAGAFRGGLARVKTGNSWSFIDVAGREVLRLGDKFHRVSDFENGMAAVTVLDGEEWLGFINRAGREVAGGYTGINDFSEGLAAVEMCCGFDQDGWGFIDTTGRIVIPRQFDGAMSFSQGLAAVQQGDTWGFIDRTGTFVIAPRFRAARQFSEGLAPVQLADGWGYIDSRGEIVIAPQFMSAEPFSNGYAGISPRAGRGTHIDREGRIVENQLVSALLSAESVIESARQLGSQETVERTLRLLARVARALAASNAVLPAAEPPPAYRSIWRDLADMPIEFTGNSNEPIMHRLYLLRADSEVLEADLLYIATADIREMAGTLEATRDRWPMLDSGRFAGVHLVDAMARATPADVHDFLRFVRSHPARFGNQTWKITETYATWMLNGTPPPAAD